MKAKILRVPAEPLRQAYLSQVPLSLLLTRLWDITRQLQFLEETPHALDPDRQARIVQLKLHHRVLARKANATHRSRNLHPDLCVPANSLTILIGSLGLALRPQSQALSIRLILTITRPTRLHYLKSLLIMARPTVLYPTHSQRYSIHVSELKHQVDPRSPLC